MPNPTDYNEHLLLEKLRCGDEGAFEMIFRRYWRVMFTTARAKVHSREEAEEIVQTIFLALWEKREKLLITNLPYYLQTAVRNSVINNIRSKITRQKYWNYYKNCIPQHQETTQDAVAFDTLTEAVEEAVNKLPEKSRQVFRLSRMEGRSITEIAGILKLSEKAIEYHITKSLKELRVYLKDFILMIYLISFF